MRKHLPAALAGAGTGLYLGAVERILVAALWPREGETLFLLALLGAPAGAAALFALSRSGSGEGGSARWAAVAWALAAFAALRDPAGSGLLLAAPAFLAGLLLFAGGEGPLRRHGGVFLLFFGLALATAPLLSCSDPRFSALAGIVLGAAAAFPGGGGKDRWLRGAAALLVTAAAFVTVPPWKDGDPAIAGTEEGSWVSRVLSWSGDATVGVAKHEEGWGLLSVSGGLRELTFGDAGSRDIPRILDEGPDGVLDVLGVGIPGGAILGNLLSREIVAVDIVEPDPVVARRYPIPPRYRSTPLFQVHAGSPRRFIARAGKRYDLVVIAPRTAPAPALAAALAFREDPLTTVEAFRDYLSALQPEGVLLYEGTAAGRVVATLREAAGDADDFSDGLLVFGRNGRAMSECYYRPAGFSGRHLRRVNRYAREQQLKIFTSPESKRMWNLYQVLAREEHLEGLAFTSGRDLSPARDERPFFGHSGRVMLSPPGQPLPEDIGRGDGEWKMQFVPPEDRGMWALLMAALLLSSVTIALPLLVVAHRSGLAGHAAPYPAVFLTLGAGIAAALRSLLGFARWLEPSAGPASWVPGLFLAAAGLGWMTAPAREEAWKRAGLPLAALLALPGLGGYALTTLPAAPAAIGVLLPALLTAAAGFLAGQFAGSLIDGAGEVIPATGAWHGAVTLQGAAAGWVLANLAAATFGFPLLWLLSAAAITAAAAAGRRL